MEIGGNNLSLSFYIFNHVRRRPKPGGVCISNSNTMYRYQKLGSNSRLENTENWARLRVKVHFFRITALLLVAGGLPYIGARANSIRIYALGDLGCKLSLFKNENMCLSRLLQLDLDSKYLESIFFM